MRSSAKGERGSHKAALGAGRREKVRQDATEHASERCWGRRPREVQFNHVYTDAQDPDSYANLANLCVTPSFLAKLTDTHADVRALLKFRAWDLYGWHPQRATRPEEPESYKRLVWAEPLPAVLGKSDSMLVWVWHGGLIGLVPERVFQSVGVTPEAWTLTRTSPGPGSGSGVFPN